VGGCVEAAVRWVGGWREMRSVVATGKESKKSNGEEEERGRRVSEHVGKGTSDDSHKRAKGNDLSVVLQYCTTKNWSLEYSITTVLQ
jgi:hypothetical protein